MICGRCAEPVPDGAQFCGNCGARIEAAANLVGKTIAGRYRLLRQVGEGGMGSVYEAEQTLGSSQRSVAVKLLRPEWSHDPAVKARFHREAATVARLEHFNTVRVYDFGATEDGTLYIVMEYLQGRSLQKALDDSGPLGAERALHIASQVAASLEEAHGLGIVHRDLKPDNILLIDSYASQRDVVKLVDFGIAKGQPALGAATTRLTELGAFVGTPAYMSPEQFTAGGVGPASDIYSLAVTTYQMLAGRLPFDAQTALEWAQAHTAREAPPLAEDYGAGRIPEAMRSAVRRALSKSVADRPGSVRAFADELSGRPRAPEATAPTPAAAEPTPAGQPAPGGAPKTAPMIELPELGAAAAGPPATQAMSAFRQPAAREPAGVAVLAAPPPPAPRRSAAGRALLWTLIAFAGTAGLSLGAWALYDNQLWPGQARGGESLEPPPLVPAATSPRPDPAPEPAPEPPPEPAPEPQRPSASTPKEPRPTPPRPAPSPAPSPKPPEPSPSLPSGTLPQLPGLPAPAQPGTATPGAAGASGAAGAPGAIPAPGSGTSPLPVPQLPWSLPTAGSCERCLQALQAGGNYSVVTAVGESLLCEDRVARASCEKQIEELAPAVAESAARGGDCPAALATAAAAVNVRVSPDRFSAVNALCLR